MFDPDAEVDLRLWGKERGLGGSRYPLICHGLDAAAAVRALWRDYLAPGLRRRLATAVGVSPDEACALLEFWASLHDIGKITPSFARQITMPPEFPADSVGRRTVRHDQATHLWLPTGLESLGYSRQKARSTGRRVAQLLGGHHGTFEGYEFSELKTENLPYKGLGEDPEWETQRSAMLAALVKVLSPPTPSALPFAEAASVAGLVVLADWLVSQTWFVRSRLPHVPEHGDTASLEKFFASSVESVGSVVSEAGLSRVSLRAGSFKEEFPGFSPNSLQSSIAAELPGLVVDPGLLMVAAPMGFGKTETALHAARILGEAAGTSGMFVALPTMATADQMFSRVARYLMRRSDSSSTQALLHGMAWLSPVDEILKRAREAEGISSDADSQVHATEWLRGQKRGLLAGVGVGTIDQALLSVLPVKHNALRLFSLAGKTVVIDEVHAFDTYMRRLLRDLLSWLGKLGVPVVLLSATLPRVVADELACAYTGNAQEDNEAVPYPGWRYVERDRTTAPQPVEFPDERRRPIEVELHGVAVSEGRPDRIPSLREKLTPITENAGCAAVICTTVAHAQETYSGLRTWAHEHGVRLFLLHSRFPMHQREQITQEVVNLFGKPEEGNTDNRPYRSVVVATQVIEQSLDVDFDLVISDLAPIELLLQRAGRLQRHPAWDEHRPAWADPGRGGHRRLVVLTTPDRDLTKLPRSWSYIYPAANLARSHELLARREHEPIRIPDDVQEMVDLGNPGDLPQMEDELLAGHTDAEIERAARCMVENQFAESVSIGPVHGSSSLAALSERQIDEEKATTRFNADSVRVLPIFIGSDEVIRLGGPAGAPLPTPDGERLTREQSIAVMQHSIPVPGSLVRDRDERHQLPEPWRDLWPLSDLVALPHHVDGNGRVQPAQVGDRHLLLDADIGLHEVV